MKKTFFLIFTLTICFNVFSQKTENEKVADIRVWYKEVTDNLKSYEKTMVDAPDESTEGGMITYYKDEDDIRLIKEEYFGESGNVSYSYYFRNGSLFFMFKVQKRYDVPIYVDDSGKGSIEENRFYFYSNEMIRWLDNNKEKVDKESGMFSKTSATIKNDAYYLYEKGN